MNHKITLWVIGSLAVLAAVFCCVKVTLEKQAIGVYPQHLLNFGELTLPSKELPPVKDEAEIARIKEEDEKLDKYNLFNHTLYYAYLGFVGDGDILSGKYAGYHRLIAYLRYDGAGEETYLYILATKDYQTFILDNSNSSKDAARDRALNMQKIQKIDLIPFDFPRSIDLGKFVLERTIDSPAAYWYPYDDTFPKKEDLSEKYTLLENPLNTSSSLKFYGTQIGSPTNNGTILGSTDVLVRSDAGTVFRYTFMPKEEAPSTDDSPSPHHGFYAGNEIIGTTNTYDRYGILEARGCGGYGYDTLVLGNVTKDDLKKFGRTASGVELYIPKDKNSQLNRDQYKAKVTDIEFFADYNGKPAPSFSEYVAKNPVLMFQDYWGRWIGIGETEYLFTDGCGKPVIYLYPQATTTVSVAIEVPVHFSADIPTYHDGWKVLATPDSNLTDLQSEYTNCSKIDFARHGSEYGKKLCSAGAYPYLYWAGKVDGRYPTPQGGWIVRRENIGSFLEEKLSLIGLNKKEREDMIEYWEPELMQRGAKFYRLSLFQTDQMNDFVPMHISPTPDTMIRVFLDWEPLNEVPLTPLEPEKLIHIERKGFTVVEWGGLK